jgi:hypothetical protein
MNGCEHPFLGGIFHLVGEPAAAQFQEGRAVYVPPVQMFVHPRHVLAQEGSVHVDAVACQVGLVYTITLVVCRGRVLLQKFQNLRR